jgi:hypothetical protein
MKVASALAISLAICLSAPAVFAAPSEGELLFREGRQAMQEKNFDRACVKFAESQKKEPAPGTALNLGDCEEQRGRLIAASEAFMLAASTFTSPEKQRYATSRAEAADRRTPRLTVRASSPATGLVVHVGNNVIPVDTEVKMDPGEVVIRAEAPGRRPNTLKATLREGKNVEIDVGVLESTSGTAATKPKGGGGTEVTTTEQPADKGKTLRTAGLIVGGVGAASLVVGAVTGILTLDRASTVKDRCGEELQCDREGLDAAESGSTLSLVSTITVAAGGAALVGGAVLYFVLAPRASKSTGNVQLMPTASHDTAGFLLRGSF